MDTQVCSDTPCPEHQPGHTGHGSTPTIASPGLEGPRKPVARTGPVHVFVLEPSATSRALSAFLCFPPVTCTRSFALSLAHFLLCTTSTASYTRCHFTGGFKKARSTPPFPTRLVVALRKTLLPSQPNRPNCLVISPTSNSAHYPSTQTFGNPNNKVTAAQHRLVGLRGKTKLFHPVSLQKSTVLLSPKILKDIRTNHMPQERRLFPSERLPEKKERAKNTPRELLHSFTYTVRTAIPTQSDHVPHGHIFGQLHPLRPVLHHPRAGAERVVSRGQEQRRFWRLQKRRQHGPARPSSRVRLM